MNYKKYFAGAFAFALALSAVSCGDSKKDSQSSGPQGSGSAEAETSQGDAPEPVTAEETTEEELPPPEPTECDDPTAVTFDDGDFSFALAKTTDPDSAVGELSVEEVTDRAEKLSRMLIVQLFNRCVIDVVKSKWFHGFLP